MTDPTDTENHDPVFDPASSKDSAQKQPANEQSTSPTPEAEPEAPQQNESQNPPAPNISADSVSANQPPENEPPENKPPESDTPENVTLENVNVKISFRIGEVSMPVNELAALTPGFTLTDLPNLIFPRAHAIASGHAFAEGELVEIDGKIGFRITRLLS